eukprot:TRINITY_DN1072_c0_g2_i3.p1 TRINITY_DN1072_c0_g2~~TRINITY_DN1072_c0_g2_i3.p1  ORF type:complete len:1002 (+),score=311.22 TRINITY_DN1072_c0_g2_i3:109-3114(+)
MYVNAGAQNDPPKLQGLAHYVEHLLFLGSKAHPDPLAYRSYLNDHGGRSNAGTSKHKTVYFFSINAPYLSHVLDIFANRFVAPLFDPRFLSSEVHAVHNEYQMKIRNHGRRTYVLLREISDPAHPFYQFPTGSLETLRDRPKQEGIDVVAEVRKFFETYYTPDQMHLSVLGRESLDEQEKTVRRLFEKIPASRGRRRPRLFNKLINDVSFKAFPPAYLNRLVLYRPTIKAKLLTVLFPLELDLKDPLLVKATRYIKSFFLLHGRGTLLASLTRERLISSLAVGSNAFGTRLNAFTIQYRLTTKGLSRVDEIVARTFDFISKLRQHGIKRSHYEKLGQASFLQFRYIDGSQSAFKKIRRIGNLLGEVDPRYVLVAPGLFLKYDKQQIARVLDHMTISRSIIMVGLRKFKDSKTAIRPPFPPPPTTHPGASSISEFIKRRLSLDRRELYYSLYFSNLPLNSFNTEIKRQLEYLKSKDHRYTLEKRSPYQTTEIVYYTNCGTSKTRVSVAEDYKEFVEKALNRGRSVRWSRGQNSACVDEKRRKDKKDYSVVGLIRRRGLQVFVKKDRYPRVPKVFAVAELKTLAPSHSAGHHMLRNIYFTLLRIVLRNRLRDAKANGYFFKVVPRVSSFAIRVKGFNQHLPRLLRRISRTIHRFVVPQRVFNWLKRSFTRRLQSEVEKYPVFHALKTLKKLLNPTAYLNSEYLSALDQLTYSDLIRYQRQMHHVTRATMLLYGNLNKKHARSLSRTFLRPIRPRPHRRQVPKKPKLTFSEFDKHAVVFRSWNVNQKDLNHVTINYYMLDKGTRRGILDVLLLRLMQRTMRGKAFHYLRTKLQLGYVVKCFVIRIGGTLGLGIVVQGTKRLPHQVDRHIERFLQFYRKSLVSLSEERIASIRDAFVSVYKKPIKRFNQRATLYWRQVRSHGRFVRFRRLLARHAQNITKQTLLDFFDRLIGKESHKLSIQKYSCVSYSAGQLPSRTLDPSQTVSGKSSKLVTEFEKMQGLLLEA